MGAECCRRETNNDVVLDPGDERAASHNLVEKAAETSVAMAPIISEYGHGFSLGRDGCRKRYTTRCKKWARQGHGRGRSQRALPPGIGLTAGHKYRKNNVPLAVVCPCAENEECEDYEGPPSRCSGYWNR